jgi:uncharacterized protein YeaO (DUF488 family)
MIRTKRAYEEAAPGDGLRFLVDRLWPRGVRKEDLKLTMWLRDASPSNELRKWYQHEPEKWNEFQGRYCAELGRSPKAWQPLLEAARDGDVTLVFSSKELERNNAVALKIFLEQELKRTRSHRGKRA